MSSKDKNFLKNNKINSMGFGTIPKMVTRDKELSIEAKAIYAYLASFAGSGDTAYPSVSLMCAELNISEGRFYRHRKQLIEKNYIRVTQQKDGESWANNIYQLVNNPQSPSIQNEGTQNECTQNEGTQNEGTITNSTITNSNITNSSKEDTKEASKDSKEKDQVPYKEIIDHLNKKANKKIMHKAEGNRKLIRARWNEGYRLDDFIQVIDNMTNEWLGVTFSDGTPAENYLHPTTLFTMTNFDKYLNRTSKVTKTKKGNKNKNKGQSVDDIQNMLLGKD